MKVLLLEDNPADARLIREALGSRQRRGIELETADRLEDGLIVLSTEDVDVALIDLTLPDSSGLETVRAVREAEPDLPIVVLTGLDDERVGLEAVRAGAQDYLVKGQVNDRSLERALLYARQRGAKLQELERANEELHELALTDPLTGLSNRRGFTVIGEQLLKQAQRSESWLIVVLADLDGLKDINDRFGHQEGDWAIVAGAQILSLSLRDADVKARIGGDEFAALAFTDDPGSEQHIKIRLADGVEQWNIALPRAYRVSFGVGTARADGCSDVTLDELLALADADLYRHKGHSIRPVV
jgi:two-component system cell cycle response regulator